MFRLVSIDPSSGWAFKKDFIQYIFKSWACRWSHRNGPKHAAV